MDSRRSGGGRGLTLVAATLALAGAPAVASADLVSGPVVSLTSGATTVSPLGSMGLWCPPSASPPNCIEVPPPTGAPGQPVGVARYPFSGQLDFEFPPSDVSGSLVGADGASPEAEPVSLARIDADSWSLTVPGPY